MTAFQLMPRARYRVVVYDAQVRLGRCLRCGVQVTGARGDGQQPQMRLLRRLAIEKEMRVDRLRRGLGSGVRVELNQPHAMNVHLHVLDVARKLRHVAERNAGREQRQAARRHAGDALVAD
jgi:hypothetical protein